MATASRTVTAVTEALCSIARQHIVLPRTAEEVNKIKDDFFNMAGIPNVTGCIDGTHIRIQAPTEFEQEYVNRKKYVRFQMYINDKPTMLLCTTPQHYRNLHRV